ncbi:MAG: helix-turn-helix domain-containing protein, partial [Anaerolineae bacterium]|nr:helix-turn-helix domain-containing protein [Anaerolineae bacterium]
MDSQSLGRYLRQTREERELTLEEAEEQLRIRRRILESFELGAFDLPNFSPVQIAGFIRNYARFLNLDE